MQKYKAIAADMALNFNINARTFQTHMNTYSHAILSTQTIFKNKDMQTKGLNIALQQSKYDYEKKLNAHITIINNNAQDVDNELDDIMEDVDTIMTNIEKIEREKYLNAHHTHLMTKIYICIYGKTQKEEKYL